MKKRFSLCVTGRRTTDKKPKTASIQRRKSTAQMEWSGGRSGAGAVTVYLNVYDLVANNWGHSFGLGLYHTGTPPP
jgi:hypothetical protein